MNYKIKRSLNINTYILEIFDNIFAIYYN